MFCKYCGQRIDDDSVFCAGCGRALGAAPNAKTSVGNNVTVQTGYTPLSGTRTASRPIWRTLYFVVFGLWALSAILMCVDWFSIDILGRSVSGNVFSVLKLNEAMEDTGMFNSGSPLEDIATVIIIGLVISIGLVIASIILFVKDKKVCCITGIAASAVMIFFSAVTIASANDLPYYYAGIFELTSAPTILLIVSIAAVILLIASFVKNPDKVYTDIEEKDRTNYFIIAEAVASVALCIATILYYIFEIRIFESGALGKNNGQPIVFFSVVSILFTVVGLCLFAFKERKSHKNKISRLILNSLSVLSAYGVLAWHIIDVDDYWFNGFFVMFVASVLFAIGYALSVKREDKENDLLGTVLVIIASAISLIAFFPALRMMLNVPEGGLLFVYVLCQFIYPISVCVPMVVKNVKNCILYKEPVELMELIKNNIPAYGTFAASVLVIIVFFVFYTFTGFIIVSRDIDIVRNRYTSYMTISDLSELKHLRRVELYHNGDVIGGVGVDFSDVSENHSIEGMDLSRTDITSFYGIENLEELKGLFLYHCNISDVSSLEALGDLRNIKNIYVRDEEYRADVDAQMEILKSILPDCNVKYYCEEAE